MTRPITVLVQLNSLGLGGTQITAVDFAASLRSHGFESVLIGPRDTLPSGPSLFDVAREKGVRVESFTRPTTVIAGSRFLSRAARECGADLVHVYGSGNARSAYWGPSLLARRPLVLTVYEMNVSPLEFASPPLIVGTGYLIDDLNNRPGLTRLISPPVDLSRDRAGAVDTTDFLATVGALREKTVRIVLVSRLDEEMKALSVETAVLAVGRSTRTDLQLIIVGSGDAEERLRALARSVNVRLGRAAVIFAGSMADPRAAYASADIALGMGSSAARALAFGRSLIVVGEFGWSRIFERETAAQLFRNSFWSDEAAPTAVDDLVRDIEDLAADPARRAHLQSFGREFSEANYGLDTMTSRLASVYRAARVDYGRRDWARDLGREWAALSQRWTRRPDRGRAIRQPLTLTALKGTR